MARLSLCLLGGFAATLDGEPIRGFYSNKVRALLAYLALESDRLHLRELLATMFWSKYQARTALINLRNALANLRKVLNDRDAVQPFILVTQDNLQLNLSSVFLALACILKHIPEITKPEP